MGGAAPCWSADPDGSPWPTDESFRFFGGVWLATTVSVVLLLLLGSRSARSTTGSDMGQTAEPVKPLWIAASTG
jgi:hypothetical protein